MALEEFFRINAQFFSSEYWDLNKGGHEVNKMSKIG